MEERRVIEVRYFLQLMGDHSLWKMEETHRDGRRVRQFFIRENGIQWTGGDSYDENRPQWKLKGETADGWIFADRKGKKRARIIEEQAIRKASIPEGEDIAVPAWMYKSHGSRYKKRSQERTRWTYEVKEITHREAEARLLMEEL